MHMKFCTIFLCYIFHKLCSVFLIYCKYFESVSNYSQKASFFTLRFIINFRNNKSARQINKKNFSAHSSEKKVYHTSF